MRFDQWLLKHINAGGGVGRVAYDFKITGYNPLFKYRYCDLFIRCYAYARYEHKRLKIILPFSEWLLGYVTEWGLIGNLARDISDGMICVDAKYKYCRGYVRFFVTCRHRYSKTSFKELDKLDCPLNLDSPIEGVKRVSLFLIEHPCFSGFDIFPELKNYPAFKDCVYRS